MNQTEAFAQLARWDGRHRGKPGYQQLSLPDARWCLHALTGGGFPTDRAKTAQHFAICGINGKDPWASASCTLPPATQDDILAEVCKAVKVNRGDVLSSLRRKDVVRARRIAMYLMRELLGASLRQIADYFGMSQHGSVIYHLKQIGAQIRTDAQLVALLEVLTLECSQIVEDAENGR